MTAFPRPTWPTRCRPRSATRLDEWEEGLRDLLATLGLDEVVSYRLTSPEDQARLLQTEPEGGYVSISNPIAPEKRVLRRSLLASVLDDLERNARLRESLALFEIGPVFEPVPGDLPEERKRLAIAMTGLREPASWDASDAPQMDFFDIKGRIELLLSGLHYTGVSFAPTDSVGYLHPGKAAEVRVDGQSVGVLGELHPRVVEKYDFAGSTRPRRGLRPGGAALHRALTMRPKQYLSSRPFWRTLLSSWTSPCLPLRWRD